MANGKKVIYICLMQIKLHPWSLPPHIVNKHELTDDGQTIGTSFLNRARVFRVPGYDEAFIMECDLHGEPMDNHRVTVLFPKHPQRITIIMTHEFLFNMSTNELKCFLNSNLLN